MSRWPRSPRWLAGAVLVLATGGCYRGGERDKAPPPGLPGGLCLAPDGVCDEGTCNRSENYCYDPVDPCFGFFCGGEERGICAPDANGLPACQCAPDYSNLQFALYCCPLSSSGIVDPACESGSTDSVPPSADDGLTDDGERP